MNSLFLFCIGLISILGQVVLLRELNVALYGVELFYILALGMWLLWGAAGTWIGSRINTDSSRTVSVLFLLWAVFLLLDVLFIRGSRVLFAGVPGAYLSFLQQFGIVILAMLPPGLLLGWLFWESARQFCGRGKTLAAAYAVECAGGVIGGLLATVVLPWGVRNLAVALVCGIFALVAAAVSAERRPRPFRFTVFVLSFIWLCLLWPVSAIDRGTTAWNHPDLLESRDSAYGRVTVTGRSGQVAVYENDVLSFETEGTDAAAFVHPAALQHPRPRSVLVLGGGPEGLVAELIKHRPAQITVVDLNPVLVGIVLPWLPPTIRDSLRDRTVRLVYADPRQFLARSGSCDLVLVGMPEPDSGQANRFYTEEFFRQCARRLNPGGVMALRLRSAENYWSPALRERMLSVHAALSRAFPHVVFLPGTTNVILASATPLPSSPAIPVDRWQERGLTARLVSPPYLRYLYTNDRFSEINLLLRAGDGVPNSDTRPLCYRYTLLLWLSKFFPALGNATVHVSTRTILLASGLTCLGLVLLFLLSRLKEGLRRGLLVFTAAFIGMVQETILILYYQVKQGVLYRDIGLLLMAFMAGLALGAFLVNHWLVRGGSRAKRWRGPSILAGFLLLTAGIAALVGVSIPLGLTGAALLLGASGFFVAAVFAYASIHGVRDQGHVIAPLYGADLFGGCLASLLAGLVLVPLLGLNITAILMVGPVLLAFLLA